MTLNQHKHKKLRRFREFEERSTMGKLINRIQGSRLLISSLPGSALRMHVVLLGKPRDVNKRSKPCLVNLILKDTHLVFSMYQIPQRFTHVSAIPQLPLMRPVAIPQPGL